MNIGIVGGSGYVGGELLRLLLMHSEVDVTMVTSQKYAQEFIFGVHPNLRGKTKQKFVPYNHSEATKNCDIIFTALPHGSSLNIIPELLEAGLKVIDMGADFRLKNPDDYDQWYGWKHRFPDLLQQSVYGLPELHRDKIRNARLIACTGCMAVTTILGLIPLVKASIIENNRIVVDVKIGSSGAGAIPTTATHHAERCGGIRPYKPVGHRHLAEIEQELNQLTEIPVKLSFTPHGTNMVRGILATIHTFMTESMTNRELWRLYRSQYENEPFIRLVQYKKGLYQYPNPKIVAGSNFCDIGFEIDSHINRLVVFSALDNLMKGAAGQGIQCLNLILGIDEMTGLEHTGFHPG